MSAIAHWFKNRRSTALGINAFSSSIGGTVFPAVFRNLLVTVGYAQIINPPAHHLLRFAIASSGRLELLHQFWSLPWGSQFWFVSDAALVCVCKCIDES